MDDLLQQWGKAAFTSVGFFWSALWAFALGYIVSSMIQVFVTQKRMKRSMGGEGVKQVGLAAFFGFISSSCSFAALATTRSLFKKGAGFVPSMAFLLSSTNLVIELGIVISIFLSWQFVVGEYLGGALLILLSWLFIRLTDPKKLIESVRKRFRSEDEEDGQDHDPDWKQQIRTWDGWKKVGHRYVMEWGMVWKDVTVGFTVAGLIAAFVPREFFETLFIGTGSGPLSFLQILEHTVIGPVAAFLTFIGSMGNIPLAALLFDNGVSFAGVMAFIFSDLVVFPVLRINANYYGWKMSLYIAAMLFFALVGTTLMLHYGLDLLQLLPKASGISIVDREHFKLNYTFYLNLVFIGLSAVMYGLNRKREHHHGSMNMADKGKLDVVLKWLAYASFAWLGIGMVLHFVV